MRISDWSSDVCSSDLSAVFRIGADGANLAALTELFGQVWVEPFMVQEFSKEVAGGDKRIVLVDGEVAGAINRMPGKGEIRSNLEAGGYAEKGREERSGGKESVSR